MKKLFLILFIALLTLSGCQNGDKSKPQVTPDSSLNIKPEQTIKTDYGTLIYKVEPGPVSKKGSRSDKIRIWLNAHEFNEADAVVIISWVDKGSDTEELILDIVYELMYSPKRISFKRTKSVKGAFTQMGSGTIETQFSQLQEGTPKAPFGEYAPNERQEVKEILAYAENIYQTQKNSGYIPKEMLAFILAEGRNTQEYWDIRKQNRREELSIKK